MPDHLDSVKVLARNFRSWSKTNADEKPELSKRQMSNAETLDALIAEVTIARARLTPLSTEYGDISDLPPEVVAELNLAKIDKFEYC